MNLEWLYNRVRQCSLQTAAPRKNDELTEGPGLVSSPIHGILLPILSKDFEQMYSR